MNHELTVQCPDCDLKFYNEKFMNYHRKKIHYKKSNKNNKALYKRTIEDHELTHRSRKKKKTGGNNKDKRKKTKFFKYYKNGKYVCNLCYGPFKFSRNIRKHMNEVHSLDKTFIGKTFKDHELTVQCPDCDLRFYNEKFMNYHRRRIQSL